MIPFVSIITPCYNAESFISQTIESVLSQTYSNWEMIIVDDCSKDGSANIINNYVQSDSRIKYLKTEKPSGSPAFPRNVGIEVARGRYIAFLDSDDIWLPNKLKEQLNVINQEDVAVVFSNYEKMDSEGGRNARIIIAPTVVDYFMLLKGNCIGCLTAMYDTEKVGKHFFKRIGHEDYLMWLSILKKGFKAQNTNTVTALYRVGNQSVSSNKLKILSWQWIILRNEEKLGLVKSSYFYLHYAVKAFFKAIK